MEFLTRDEGNVSIRPWRTGISARINSRERREAVSFDGIIGTHGIPSSSQGRGQVTEWEWEGREQIASSGTQKRLAMMARLRIISVTYVSVMLFLGIIWQGGIT